MNHSSKINWFSRTTLLMLQAGCLMMLSGALASCKPAPEKEPTPDIRIPSVIYHQQPRAFEQVPVNAARGEALEHGVNPWHYWGAEFDNTTKRLSPQVWRETADVIDGWDWSLPPGTEPAENARVRFGFHGWKSGIDTYNPPPGIKVIDELWFSWRDLEETEGQYDFSKLETAIAQRLEAGCDGIIIRMLGSVWSKGTPEEQATWKENEQWRFSQWSAPRWLVETYGVDQIFQNKNGNVVVHVDIFHPVYHRKYQELIDAFEKSGLLQRPEVQGLIVCGMTNSNGEEGYSTYDLSKVPEETAKELYTERLYAWKKAFGPGKENSVIAMMADGETMVGFRDGFVEMYLYLTDDPEMRGQYVDKDGYLSVNEDAFYIRHGDELFFGDENEEYYPPRWADQPGRPGRFGPVESFNYRYFTSMLRVLQMRRNYLYAEERAVNPELMWYVLHGLGQTADTSVDAWSFLRESKLKSDRGGIVKNFERWLYQRDRPGYETTPAIRIPHALDNWWLQDPEHRYDYVARRGERIGFFADENFISGKARVAVKVSYYDGYPGSWTLHYNGQGTSKQTDAVYTTGTDTFRTATFFIDADFEAERDAFDLEIHSPGRIPISFVRMIKQ